MGKTKDIQCFKKCGFIGGSPNAMHEHYVAYPGHKRTYVPERTYNKKAIDQLHSLLDTFNAEIAQELNTIKSLQDEIDTRKAHLSQLKAIRDRLSGGLSGGTTTERPEFHEAVAGMVMDSLGRTE